EWNSDLFDAATGGRLAASFSHVLRSLLAAPERPLSRFALLSPEERDALVVQANRTATAKPRDAAVHRLFEEQAARAPERVAIATDDLEVPYGELEERANRLARHLISLGVAAEAPIGVALERSPDLIVAFLAVLKAGGCYVPLDPSYPRERLALMAEEVGLALLLSEERLAAELPLPAGGPAAVVLLDRDRDAIARNSADPLALPVSADGLAYVMFTSGSTGRPKGVGVPHRAIVRLVQGSDFIRFGRDEVFLQLAPVSFDAATLEIWGALLHGGRLALFPGRVPSLAALGLALRRHRVTTLWLTAGLFHQVAQGPIDVLRTVEQLLAGGDVLAPEAVNRTLAELPGTVLVNGYGPTENTTFTCCHTVRAPVPAGGTVPIGRPISNSRAYVLDRAMEPVPQGAPGELYAGGDGLARGYLNRPELTAQRFVPSPFGGQGDEPAGARLYRTGDRVRVRPDGEIEFLGRLDTQVKIRGFRIEPGEVEAAVARLPGVREAAVVERGPGGEKSLAAYVVATGPAVAAAALRDELRRTLPEPLLPAAFVLLPALPL
ncbi:MAG TPA: amino acid adenylation domain-containing protein, partial [Thermoanaerobaculia bacterium]